MACATPVVGTNRGGVPEVLGGAGVTVNPEDTRAFAAELSKLLDSPSECVRLGQIGLERARTIFEWRVVANSWREFLSDFAQS
jgi:glycosyltransferase involved in cell wall biosynthesis